MFTFTLLSLLPFLLLIPTIECAENTPSNSVASPKSPLRSWSNSAIKFAKRIAKKPKTWKAANYPDALVGEIMAGLSNQQVHKPERQTAQRATNSMSPPIVDDSDLPTEFDARQKWFQCADVIGKIWRQHYCGSCWAVASASVMSDRICIMSMGTLKVHISARQIVSCAKKNGCLGGQETTAFEYWNENGVVSNVCQPYSPFYSLFYAKCQSSCSTRKSTDTTRYYGALPNFLEDEHETVIRREIYRNGPVVAGINVHWDLVWYTSGIYKNTAGCGLLLPGHAIRLLGWGEEAGTRYWLAANSWGTKWGERGTFRLARGENVLGVEDFISFAEPDFLR